MLIENCIVKTRWNNKTKDHYIEKGYKFTKYGEELFVRATDLKESSDVFVDVVCDYCGKEYQMQYKKYVSRVIKNEYVKKCACEECLLLKTKEVQLAKYGIENWRKTEEGRKLTSEQAKKYDIDFVRKEFEKEGYKLLTNEYLNNSQILYYECPKHGIKHTTFNHFYNNNRRCKDCFYERNKGENNNKWNGGINSLNSMLRAELKKEWVRKSLEEHDYTCYITKEKGQEMQIHHLTPFKEVVKKALVLTGFEYRNSYNIKDFTKEELDKIISAFLELSMDDLGIPIKKELHIEFHKRFGYPATKEDFELFVKEKTKKQNHKDY